MPSTQDRLYADLITLIREIVSEVEDEERPWQDIRAEIMTLASKEERNAINKFASWFTEDFEVMPDEPGI